MTTTNETAESTQQQADFVTVYVGEQMFGIPIGQVLDVFRPQRITAVPLAHPDIAGVLNLRGRIVTAINCRSRLGLGRSGSDVPLMAVGIERNGESYGLIIDKVGEVLSLPASDFEANPANLDSRWRSVSMGVYRLEGKLLVVLDVAALLELDLAAA
ncbi:MAG TPA: chemotaxis protein CheW [Alphaproteobacteria bacterium]|nr:chemotaxis protein CheW [Alphaproteobacteria bacterium]HAJ47307.1 chemotaxis protein CheW [Alphaproteobacteria bacterium]